MVTLTSSDREPSETPETAETRRLRERQTHARNKETSETSETLTGDTPEMNLNSEDEWTAEWHPFIIIEWAERRACYAML